MSGINNTFIGLASHFGLCMFMDFIGSLDQARNDKTLIHVLRAAKIIWLVQTSKYIMTAERSSYPAEYCYVGHGTSVL